MRGSVKRARLICCLVIVVCASACAQVSTDTMVFGERTGVNVGVIVDPGKTAPIELNTGFRRQVIGVIPPSQVDSQGRPAGEAVNMASHFEIKQVVDQNGNPLNGGLAMRGGFMSGGAASGFFGSAEPARANAVANKLAQSEIVTVQAPSAPSDIQVSNEIVTLINANPNVVAPEYLRLAQARGLTIAEHPIPQISATQTAQDSRNAAANREILAELKNL